VSVFSRRPKVWLGDITYIATDEGWLYLAGILDLYSRRLTGWAMSEHIDTQLILTACPRWR
jgi:transposase InsO family protein